MNDLVDLQVNGYAGVDFNAADLTHSAMREACQRLRDDGVVRFFPTVITDDLDGMVGKIKRLSELAESDAFIEECVGGIHVEGPFLNRNRGFIGAHPAEHAFDASVDAAERLIDAGAGRVRLFTLAPEVDGAVRLIARLRDLGIIVAAGHTDASLADLDAAIDAGLQLFTHLGNGCPSEMHRHDNIVQRALARSQALFISMIADGHHVPWFAMQNYLQCIPKERVIIVSDAISAAGLGPGSHRLGGQTVHVDENGAAWMADRTQFAGCATTLRESAQMMLEQDLATEEDLRRWMTANPSRLLDAD
ncbi:MAG: N-acetylglucosamine-6-phosphate deacetylase [Planctomycetota bacterium]